MIFIINVPYCVIYDVLNLRMRFSEMFSVKSSVSRISYMIHTFLTLLRLSSRSKVVSECEPKKSYALFLL